MNYTNYNPLRGPSHKSEAVQKAGLDGLSKPLKPVPEDWKSYNQIVMDLW
jgi:hypothetical protein